MARPNRLRDLAGGLANHQQIANDGINRSGVINEIIV